MKTELKPIDTSKYKITETGQVLKMTKEELEKENAELREKLEDTEKVRDYWKESSFDWRHKCTSKKSFRDAVKAQKQLTKAKELLTRFIMSSVYFNGKETDLVEEAEQFIREAEK